MLHEGLDRNRMKIEPLSTAPNRVEELVGLGCGKNEVDVAGRLLQRLEQRVAGRLREHVRLVEDVHPFGTSRRSNRRNAHPHVADVINTVVRGGIQLDHIH